MGSLRKAIATTLLASNATTVINFAGSLALARLLTPAEVGVFSIGYVLVGLARTLREMGLGSYIVQERELTPQRIRTALGLTIMSSFLFGLIIWTLSVPMGQLYRNSGVTEVVRILALSFFFIPFGATTMSLLRRALRFYDMAKIEVSSALVQNLTGVVLAYCGFSYMSLGWASIAGILFSVAMTAFYRPRDVSLRPSLKEWRHIMSFGAFASGSSLIAYADNSASDLVLGRTLNVESVALFNRASSLVTLFSNVLLQAVCRVTLPVFANSVRDKEPLTGQVLLTMRLISGVAVPFYCVLALTAHQVIFVLFGSQWDSSAPLVKALCIAAILDAPLSISGQAFIAMGLVRTQFRFGLFTLGCKIAIVATASHLGLQWVAWGFCAQSLIQNSVRLSLLKKYIGLRFRDAATTLGMALPAAACSAIAPILAYLLIDEQQHVLLLALTAFGSTIGWLIGIYISAHPLRGELDRIFICGTKAITSILKKT